MLVVLKESCALLIGLSVCWLVRAALGLPLPPPPRLGRRGANRRKLQLEVTGFGAVEPVLRFGAALVAALPLDGFRRRQEGLLLQADHAWGLTHNEFAALSVISGVALGLATGGLLASLGWPWLFALPGAAFGLWLPSLQLAEVIRKRRKQVFRRLPHAIEIASMCMGAGLDFAGALRLLARPGADTSGVLEREFQVILEQLELGHTRREALQHFSERVRSDVVRDFANAVIQAEAKGNPLANVLRVQARTLNLRRSVAAEEAAARAGVLMVLPMVLLVGCIMLLLLGPFLVNGVGV